MVHLLAKEGSPASEAYCNTLTIRRASWEGVVCERRGQIQRHKKSKKKLRQMDWSPPIANFHDVSTEDEAGAGRECTNRLGVLPAAG